MLIGKGEFYRLVAYADPQNIPNEVNEKLDALNQIFLLKEQPMKRWHQVRCKV